MQAGVTDFGLSVTGDHQAFSDALSRMGEAELEAPIFDTTGKLADA